MCSAGCGTGSPSPSRRGLHGGSRPAKTPTRPSRPGGRTPTKSRRGGGDDSDLHGDSRTGARRLVGAGGPRRGRGLPGAAASIRLRTRCARRSPTWPVCPSPRSRWMSGRLFPRTVSSTSGRPAAAGVLGLVGGRGSGAVGLWMVEGLLVVQICCKGRCGVRVAEMKPHDSAVLSAVRGVLGRLCNRFGHQARARCPIRVRCRLAGRALSRGSPVAGPRARGSIPGLVRRAGLHKQGSAPAVHRTRLACSYLTMTACRLVWA